MNEVVRSGGERARDDDRGFDAEPRKLSSIADRQGVHAGLCGDVGRKVRRSAGARAAAASPNDKALALLAQRGQHGTIHPLRAQNVDVVEFGKLLWCERLSRTEDHVACVVDNNIQTTVFCENLLDRVLDRFLRRHIHFDPAEITGMNRSRTRSEEHTSELQSHLNLVCRLLLEKKKKKRTWTEPTEQRIPDSTLLGSIETSSQITMPTHASTLRPTYLTFTCHTSTQILHVYQRL